MMGKERAVLQVFLIADGQSGSDILHGEAVGFFVLFLALFGRRIDHVFVANEPTG